MRKITKKAVAFAAAGTLACTAFLSATQACMEISPTARSIFPKAWTVRGS